MLDTTVLFAGSVWPRFPYEVLQHALRQDFRVVLSSIVLAEARRKLRELFPEYVEAFETFLQTVAYEELADPPPDDVAANQGLMRDPRDVPIALAAMLAGVDYLVSDDKDFTSPDQLVHQKLRILQSGTFLNVVMGRSHEDLERIKGRRWSDLAG